MWPIKLNVSLSNIHKGNRPDTFNRNKSNFHVNDSICWRFSRCSAPLTFNSNGDEIEELSPCFPCARDLFEMFRVTSNPLNFT